MKIDREKLKKEFRDNLSPLLMDKEVQSDDIIIEFYMEVLCDIVESHIADN